MGALSWRHAPWASLAATSITVYAVVTAGVTVEALRLNGGHLVYTLDDPYIHLAMARTWLRSGTVGISPGHFAPASSSPLWTTLLIAIGWAIGLHAWLPYALAVISSLALLAVFWWGATRIFQAEDGRLTAPTASWWWYLAAAALPVVTNLPGATLSGMEHALHAFCTLGLTIALFRLLRSHSVAARRWLYAMALIVPLVRLEGAFAVGVAAGLLALRRDLRTAILIVLLGAVPTVLMGLYFMHSGAMFLSNSIIAAGVPDETVLSWAKNMVIHEFYLTVRIDPSEGALLVVASIWLYLGWASRRRFQTEVGAYMFALTVLHIVFIGPGWFDRYDTYLIVLGLFLLASQSMAAPQRHLAGLLRASPTTSLSLLCLLVLGFGQTQLQDLKNTALASNNIYEQQYQMGAFVQKYYPHGDIVANDIGVVAYRASGTVTDLVGLGSTGILRLQRSVGGTNNLTLSMVKPILERNGVDVIVIYPHWFSPRLYGRWYRVASWTIGKADITPAYPTVVFFAANRRKYGIVRQGLQSFQHDLPGDVKVRYFRLPPA